ncbi:glucose-6-phosphate dehydrogenase [candidate division WWE3 bacterium]|nr:glucose-6-phosphate dehydrogenase [candidate division WWE3 bacterium]
MNDSFILVIFGITSNLARIKLIPALYDLFANNELPENVSIIGVARSQQTAEEFNQYISGVLQMENRHHMHPIDPAVVLRMLQTMHYVSGDVDNPNTYQKLISLFDSLEGESIANRNRIFYLATYPDLYESIFNQLKQHNMTQQTQGWVRLMIEKPIGTDMASSQKLNNLLTEYFEENQLYRLDHYLGKETMQNIISFRFANGIFEHIMNSDYIDHVQITAAEDFGIGDRGGYYDAVGALKDVGQNHLLQMLALALMDQPKSLSDSDITEKRIELFSNITTMPDRHVRGQYNGYTSEKNVHPDSITDTFFAFKVLLNDKRFKQLPIYIRGGKKLTHTVTEIAIVFKNAEDRLFATFPNGRLPNVLIYRIQPNEGIVLRLITKKPGQLSELEETYMQFCYKLYRPSLPDPYERLILDAFHGDQTFFIDAHEVEAQWGITDPYSQKKAPFMYEAGTWGPQEADELIKADHREWLEPSLAFCTL